MRLLTRLLIILLAVTAMTFVAESAQAGSKDTPEGMMVVAKEGITSATDAATAMGEMNAFFNRLSTDKDYATKLLEAIQKKDANGVVSIMKTAMPKSQITPGQLNPDFHFDFHIKVGGYSGAGCFSNDHSCEGHNVTLG